MTIATESNVSKKFHGSFWTGLLLIGFGVLGIALPTAFSIVVETWIALILASTGATKIFYAFQTREEGFAWKLLIGALYVVTGALLFFQPLTGVLTLTLLLGSFFLTEGFFNIILAFRLRSQPNWTWVLVDGILTLLLGALVWLQFPSNAPWLLGTLVGVSILFSGISRSLVAMKPPTDTTASNQPDQAASAS
ncbi:HdeD family acid-resistance protein [Myxacorys almedinensis]|uniref:HdeD family acid-resistance protein n=1 Tax=Myxacorys almedinensis A TaxID=2690445 RepID=A0A8J7Z1P3_9CYAN|nr:HdeD family acid-resistance protein [Myxacorys almedinensis]NDJ18434.1 HdeD family acid-resistance protein [Myxacorys almedinensis A]